MYKLQVVEVFVFQAFFQSETNKKLYSNFSCYCSKLIHKLKFSELLKAVLKLTCVVSYYMPNKVRDLKGIDLYRESV